MVTAPDLIDPFHRTLYARLTEELTNRVYALSAGSAIPIKEEVQTVAEKYAAQVGYIKAINDVLAFCEEIERDRYGKRVVEEE